MSYMATPGISPEITIVNFKDFDEITKTVCKITGQDEDKITMRTRKREIVWTRQVCMTLAKLKTRNTLDTIGEYFGGFDHTTVLHAMKTVKNIIETNRVIREDIGHLFVGANWPHFKN